MLPNDEELLIEARSQVYEATGIPIDKQLSLPNSQWLTMHKVAMKRYKQKLELMQLNARA